MYRLITLVVLITLSITSIQSQNQLSVLEKNGTKQVIIKNSGKELLRSPSTGLWRISHSWNNNWPDEWIDIQADSSEVFNDYQILHGSVEIQGGTLILRDAYREKNGRIQCTRRWEWLGSDTLKQLTLTVQYNSQGTNNRVLIPGVMYYGNPAGERSKRTPVLSGIPGEVSLFEEHRLPMPFVSREWGGKNNSKSAIIHSIKSGSFRKFKRSVVVNGSDKF